MAVCLSQMLAKYCSEGFTLMRAGRIQRLSLRPGEDNPKVAAGESPTRETNSIQSVSRAGQLYSGWPDT